MGLGGLRWPINGFRTQQPGSFFDSKFDHTYKNQSDLSTCMPKSQFQGKIVRGVTKHHNSEYAAFRLTIPNKAAAIAGLEGGEPVLISASRTGLTIQVGAPLEERRIVTPAQAVSMTYEEYEEELNAGRDVYVFPPEIIQCLCGLPHTVALLPFRQKEPDFFETEIQWDDRRLENGTMGCSCGRSFRFMLGEPFPGERALPISLRYGMGLTLCISDVEGAPRIYTKSDRSRKPG
jgi:hypothetical protein